MENKKGNFVISLDFELSWGIFDSLNAVDSREYFRNTRNIIPNILKVFEENRIHCTWATVGMLFNNNWQEWNQNVPDERPHYHNSNLSAYSFGEQFSRTEKSKEQCFAPDLIQKIKNTSGQEIGTHTYSHYYCSEAGQSLKDFEADLKIAAKVASERNIELKSLVFPRNQLNSEYLQICSKYGIENVRSNPSSWFWKNPNSSKISVKLARTGDAYFNFGKKSYSLSDLQKKEGLPLQQPASRFFRPYEKNSILHDLKMKRVFNEMEYAAKNNQIYHLWWHPHNFGNHPKESLSDLKQILDFFSKLRSKYNFQSVNMQEIGLMVN